MSNNTNPCSKNQPSFLNSSNPNPQLYMQNNGVVGMPPQPQGQTFMPPFMQQQSLNATPPFMNGPNHNNNNHFPLQNNHLLGQPHMGVLGPQNGVVGNANYNNPMFHVPGQVLQNAAQLNFSQQVLAQSIVNMLQQQPNMNMNMPNGQFYGPYPMQNMNQQLPMQMPNPSQGVPYGMNPGSCTPMFGFPNQVPQGMVPQNSMFSANPQLGLVPGNQAMPQINRNEKNVAPSSNVNTNAFPSQQLQGNSSGSFNPNLAQTSSPQPPAFMKSHLQENPDSNIKTNVSQSNWKGSPSKNFKNNPNRGGFQGGFQKSKFHDVNNGKRRFGKEHNGKGPYRGRAGQDGFKSKELKQQPERSLHVTYTEQEIQQWREARKKNHPFRNNIQKKHSERPKDSKAINREVLQRELKEVLAKQAELGVEVAEIPSYYLQNSENQGLQNERGNKRNFQNKFNKKSHRKGWHAKKQKFDNKGFSESPSLKKRKPTLLQKLLSADIKRDTSHLYQVFRFMVMNSFFKHCPDKPLSYPSSVVKESCSEVDGEEIGKNVLKHRNAESVQKNTVCLNNDNGHDSEDEDSDDDENDPIVDNDPHKEPSSFFKRKCDSGKGIQKSEEEEGEIIE